MIGLTTLAVLLVALLLPATTASANCAECPCDPGSNCRLPSCRCWDDPNAPGGFSMQDIPQIIVVSFEYGVNAGDVDVYKSLLSGIKNPNGCPAKASFYATEAFTDANVVSQLYKQGHEIAVSTVDWHIPADAQQWIGNFSAVKTKLVQEAKIPYWSISGARGPQLYFGGNDLITGVVSNNLLYDTTCETIFYDHIGKFLWPFTYDFVDNTPACTVGSGVTKPFPGVWQFMVPALEFNGNKCATPSSCAPYMKDSQDAFELFYNLFLQHYQQKQRPPFQVVIDPQWLLNSQWAEGTKRFLETASSFQDTWIVTAQQALSWIQTPVKACDALKFNPWSC